MILVLVAREKNTKNAIWEGSRKQKEKKRRLTSISKTMKNGLKDTEEGKNENLPKAEN